MGLREIRAELLMWQERFNLLIKEIDAELSDIQDATETQGFTDPATGKPFSERNRRK